MVQLAVLVAMALEEGEVEGEEVRERVRVAVPEPGQVRVLARGTLVRVRGEVRVPGLGEEEGEVQLHTAASLAGLCRRDDGHIDCYKFVFLN